MNPITSPDDVRLATLVGVAINVIEELALLHDISPNEILAEQLYFANRQIHELDPSLFMNKLATNYPLLSKALN